MSADKEIIREFLASLGFQVDKPGLRKFQDSLQSVTKFAGFAGSAIAGVAVAAEAMVQIFSRQMENLYYASKRSGASVQNIQALEYGAQQIGIAAGVAKDSLISMAMALRSNPGLQGFLQSLGVQVEGRDKADVLKDLVTQLNKMPFYVASQIAQMFGIDPDTLLLLEQGLDTLTAKGNEYKELQKELGIDSDAAAFAGKEYSNSLRDIWTHFGLLQDRLAIDLLPSFRAFALLLKDSLDYWTKLKASDFGRDLKDAGAYVVDRLKSMASHGSERGSTLYNRAANANLAQLHNDIGRQHEPGDAPRSTAPARSTAPVATNFAALEQKYGLPAGLLDKMWLEESGRGKNMLNKNSGAAGHFQFMPDTAKQYGLSNPYDLTQSSESAAHYMSDLMMKYGGDIEKALAAYNWGPGNVDKKGLGHLPAETRKYIADITGGQGGAAVLNQTTTINVYGAGDPQGTARAVGKEQGRVLGDATRNLAGVFVPS